MKMDDIKEMRAVVRTECLPRVLQGLKQARITRIFVSGIHAIGAGVDPEDFRVTSEEGEAFTEKSRVEFLCPAERVEELLNVIRSCGQTGHRGDGVVMVYDLAGVVSIRTGDHDRLALL
jgi:nitrogen regulatory protein PII